MLELRNVTAAYGQVQVLHGVSLKVREGTVAALLGRNGMGKTTTVHTIIGFLPLQDGEILLRGEPVAGLSPNRIAQRGIALTPQGRRIFSSLSVRENLLMAARNGRGGGTGWTLERVYEWFPRLRERASVRGTLLSGGEQQMLALARALMTNPDLLLLDEPSEGLAPMIVRDIGRIIGELKEEGLSILLVEQNLKLALAVADDVYILNKGQVVHACTPDALRLDEELQAQYLGASTGRT